MTQSSLKTTLSPRWGLATAAPVRPPCCERKSEHISQQELFSLQSIPTDAGYRPHHDDSARTGPGSRLPKHLLSHPPRVFGSQRKLTVEHTEMSSLYQCSTQKSLLVFPWKMSVFHKYPCLFDKH